MFCKGSSGSYDGPFSVVSARLNAQGNRWLYKVRNDSETRNDVAETAIRLAKSP